MKPNQFTVYNSLTRNKELFKPIHEDRVGMYVCGPTVYGDGHLGHARPAITFDILYRYLTHLGYKVRYVRNITDVGHLEHDADDGEDKIAKKARIEQLEPMEVVQYYLNRYHHAMEKLNVLPPSIEPHASGHIIEQIEYIKKILESGYAYESEGSVYFDVPKYNRDHRYGKLSGRNIDELLSTTRELDGQQEKHHPADFALWKKAAPEHIMRWPSPWSDGFPGWHLECSTMGEKYLGETFDIHGGGMDLKFPHHECEIAQSVAHNGHDSVHYWMHNNMITINGQKMGKSLGNYFVDRHLTPKDETGDYDYESLYALDLATFNSHLNALIDGLEVELPYYNFETGAREYRGNIISLDSNSILLIEGIHGLNPELTAQVADEMKYRIYVSALTTIAIDDHNWIPTTDNRLLRRIIRDARYRGVRPEETIRRWPSVRRGEERWIFPYQENADAMFNSSLLFELGVMKSRGEELLRHVPHDVVEYAEAARLRTFLGYFAPISEEFIPSTSLLREFLGGSSFKY